LNEAFLQYVWRHQLLQGREFTSTDGRALRIVRQGELNHDAGPDFFNARVAIDGVEWVGNIEVHVRTSDWNAHHHSQDKAYNNIVLHIVYEHDAEITLQSGKRPVTLELKRYIDPTLIECYDSLMQAEDQTIACADRVGEMPRFIVDGWLERLTVERIEGKAEVVRRLLDESHGGWEQTCYWLLARYFGGRVNALAFELLAKVTDQRLLARWKDNPQRLEALLMGQAGLLDGYFADEYPRQLQADYEAISVGARLKPIDGYLWKFYRVRPSSFPTIRISQFARLVSNSTSLFSTLLDMTDAAQIAALFNQTAAEYWDSHYRFDQPSPMHPKSVGRAQAEMLVINAWVPLLFVYGTVHGQQHYKDQAIDLLNQLPGENNNIIRQWKAYGIAADNAARSQALLQLHNNYCQNHRCLDCSVGYHIIKRKK